MYDIEYPAETIYYITCNPLYDIYHHGTIENTNKFSTGLPLMVSNTDQDIVYDLIYSSYVFNDDGVIDQEESILREITWAIGYTLEEANTVIGVIQTLLPNVFIQPIKHPNRDEYAIPYSDYILSTAPDGELKNILLAKHEESIAEGNVKSKQEMLLDGWI